MELEGGPAREDKIAERGGAHNIPNRLALLRPFDRSKARGCMYLHEHQGENLGEREKVGTKGGRRDVMIRK